MTVMGMLLVGLGVTSAQVMTKTEKITWYDVELEAVKTADNFLVLFNAAKTMGKPYKQSGMTHLQAAKALLEERNTLMPDLTYNAGLYEFATTLKVYYPMQPYNKASFGQAIAKLPGEASGRTEIQRALLGLEPVLKGLTGKTVVFLFTDGVNTEIQPAATFTPNEFARTPRELAQELAQKYNVCFHVVSSAPKEVEEELRRAVASINECSRVVPLEEVEDRPEYMAGSLFVMDEKVFKVTTTQQKVVGYNMKNVHFDFNSTVVKPEEKDELNKLGNFLQEHPAAYVVLAGFTDPIGSTEYNWQLSRRRVEGVRQYLQTQFQLTPDRIVTLWYGALAPIAPNDTEEGRAKNRRVAGIVAGL
jgi:OOP family OmpA-OmpF porin